MKFLAGAVVSGALMFAWCQGGSLVQRASPSAEERKHQIETNAQAIRAGARLYERECAACHGAGRQGSRGVPPLSVPEVYQADPGTLFWILRNGSLRTGMPSFAHLPEAQRRQIIAFLREPSER